MSKLKSSESQLISVSWRDLVKPYQTPEVWRSVWQIANSLIPFLIMWYLMYRSLSVSYWLTLVLVLPTEPVTPKIVALVRSRAARPSA